MIQTLSASTALSALAGPAAGPAAVEGFDALLAMQATASSGDAPPAPAAASAPAAAGPTAICEVADMILELRARAQGQPRPTGDAPTLPEDAVASEPARPVPRPVDRPTADRSRPPLMPRLAIPVTGAAQAAPPVADDAVTADPETPVQPTPPKSDDRRPAGQDRAPAQPPAQTDATAPGSRVRGHTESVVRGPDIDGTTNPAGPPAPTERPTPSLAPEPERATAAEPPLAPADRPSIDRDIAKPEPALPTASTGTDADSARVERPARPVGRKAEMPAHRRPAESPGGEPRPESGATPSPTDPSVGQPAPQPPARPTDPVVASIPIAAPVAGATVPAPPQAAASPAGPVRAEPRGRTPALSGPPSPADGQAAPDPAGVRGHTVAPVLPEAARPSGAPTDRDESAPPAPAAPLTAPAAAPAMPVAPAIAPVDLSALFGTAVPAAVADPLAAPAELAQQHRVETARDLLDLDALARDIVRTAAPDARLRFEVAPEKLGPVAVELQQSDAGTAVRLTAERDESRRILLDAQPRLQQEARAQGVRIAETHVDLGQPGGSSGGAWTGAQGQPQRQAPPPQQPHQPARAGHPDPESEARPQRRGPDPERYA